MARYYLIRERGLPLNGEGASQINVLGRPFRLNLAYCGFILESVQKAIGRNIRFSVSRPTRSQWTPPRLALGTCSLSAQ